MPTEYGVATLFGFAEGAKFYKKTSLEKVKFLSEQIEKMYSLLKKKHPYAQQLIVIWPECGVRFYIPQEIKNQLKTCMLALTKKYSDLIIIGGVSAQDEIIRRDESTKFQDIVQSYEEVDWTLRDPRKGWFWLREQSIASSAEKKQISFATDDQAFSVASNQCCVYYAEQEERHDKAVLRGSDIDCVLDLNEQGGWNVDKDVSRHIYILKPRKENNFIEINHSLTIGLEICAENQVGVLKKTVAKQKKAQPFLHVFIADNYKIGINIRHVCAEFAAITNDLLDKRYFVLARGNKNPTTKMSVYEIDINEEITLDRPIHPIYPFQYDMLDKIDDYISSEKINDKNLLILKEKILLICSDFVISREEYQQLLDFLEKNIEKSHPDLYANLLFILSSDDAKKQFEFTMEKDELQAKKMLSKEKLECKELSTTSTLLTTFSVIPPAPSSSVISPSVPVSKPIDVPIKIEKDRPTIAPSSLTLTSHTGPG